MPKNSTNFRKLSKVVSILTAEVSVKGDLSVALQEEVAALQLRVHELQLQLQLKDQETAALQQDLDNLNREVSFKCMNVHLKFRNFMLIEIFLNLF